MHSLCFSLRKDTTKNALHRLKPQFKTLKPPTFSEQGLLYLILWHNELFCLYTMWPGRFCYACVQGAGVCVCVCVLYCMFALPRAVLQIAGWQSRKGSVWFHSAAFFPRTLVLMNKRLYWLLCMCVLLMCPYSVRHTAMQQFPPKKASIAHLFCC